MCTINFEKVKYHSLLLLFIFVLYLKYNFRKENIQYYFVKLFEK